MRKFVFVLTLASLLVLATTGVVFAAGNHWTNPGDRTMNITASNCAECHAGADGHSAGPHGGYTSATDKCQACHDVHGKGENAALLMGQTLTAACQYCHDLTSTWAGPYNFSGLAQVGAAHRVVGINVYSYVDSEDHLNDALSAGLSIIPGGNSADGSEGTYSANKHALTGKDPILSGATFTCNSCHTPHGVNTVRRYLGESFVKYAKIGAEDRIYMTTRLLKQRPNNATTAVYEYSSQWCLACHSGRDDLSAEYKHNHPVNESAPAYRLVELALLGTKANAAFKGAYASQDAFYNKVGQIDLATKINYPGMLANGTKVVAGLTGKIYVTFGTAGSDFAVDPRTNQQFAMTPGDYDGGNNTPRTTWDGFDPIDRKDGSGNWVYVDKGPACQQCHGSARQVEATWAQTFGNAGNPARASFPHISANKALLVETGDDFCTNCHDPNILP